MPLDNKPATFHKTSLASKLFTMVREFYTFLEALGFSDSSSPQSTTTTSLRVYGDLNKNGEYQVYDWTPPTGSGGGTAGTVALDNTGFTVLSADNVQAAFAEADTFFRNARTTGLLFGGDLSINVSGDSFDVTAGEGQILDNTDVQNQMTYQVTWDAFTAQAPASTGVNYIYINTAGNLLQTTTPPSYEDRLDKLFLGRVIYNGTTILATPSDKDFIQQLGQQLRSLAVAQGISRISGLTLSGNAGLTFNIGSGVMFDFGVGNYLNPHEVSISTINNATFQYVTTNGTIATDRTNIDPDQYDNAGTLTTVGNNKFTIQDVYLFSSGNVRVQYGQAEYDNIQEALNSIRTRTYTQGPNLNLGFKVGFIIVRKGATSLTNSTTTQIVASTRSGE